LEASEEVQDLRAELANAQERIQDLETENKRLRQRAERSEVEPLEPLASYEEFLEDDDVQNVIKEAKQADKSSPRYIKGVIAAIVDEGGWVGYEQIAKRLGLKRTNEISSAATLLESYGVVEKEKRSGEMHVDLNVDGLNEIREAAARRRKTEQLMEEL
jgi:regulator of replication initiation timing